MKQTCEICKSIISEPYYLEVNVILIKQDDAYVGSTSFTVDERKDFTSKLIVHQKCWRDLLRIKDKDNILEVKKTVKEIVKEV